ATGPAVGNIAAGVWTVENSNGQSQPAGQKQPNNAGYQDLLGNLNEWLAAEVTGAGTAPLAGGSYLNSREELMAIPLERGTRTERMRTTGFRIVVETDSAQR
ncbi:MAG: SUMF1/EgtB/PvdO family nonheme iron enzyme, partial [Arenimonas sp.]